MNWNRRESDAIVTLASNLQKDNGLRSHSFPRQTVRLDVTAAEDLKNGLAEPHEGALLVRHLLRELGFDEERLFLYRIDHKLIQCLLLEHYCPGVTPVSIGCSRELSGLSKVEVHQRIESAYREGFFIKPSLSTGGYAINFLDSIPEIDLETLISLSVNVVPPEAETYLFQKKLAIAEEFRVHSLEDMVISDLTYSRFVPETTDFSRTARPNRFIQEIIDQLPSTLVRDSLYAWDVAFDSTGRGSVIEINPAGIHPVFRPGFQCSGFFQTRSWGVRCLSTLLQHVEETYNIAIDLEFPLNLNDPFANIYALTSITSKIHAAKQKLQCLVSRGTSRRVYPEDISNKLSAEMNTLLWVLAEITSLAQQAESSDEPISDVAIPQAVETPSETVERLEDSSDSNREFLHPVAFPTMHHNPERYGETKVHQFHEVFFRNMLGDIHESKSTSRTISHRTEGTHEAGAKQELQEELVKQIRRLSGTLKCGASSVFHLAWYRALSVISGETDILFGTTFYFEKSCQLNSQYETVRNVLPIRANYPSGSVASCLVQLDQGLRDLSRHRSASTATAHRCSGLSANSKLFDTILDYRNSGVEGHSDPNQAVSSRYNETIFEHSYKLVIYDDEDDTNISLDGSGAIPPGRMLGFFVSALSAIVEAAEKQPPMELTRIPIISQSEHSMLTLDWNRTATPFPDELTILDLIGDQFRQYPDRIAVEHRGQSLTYSALSGLIASRMDQFQQQGISHGSRVSVCLPRSPEMVITLIAVLRLGACYIPIDPVYPSARLKVMTEDSHSTVVIVDSLNSEAVRDWAPHNASVIIVSDLPVASVENISSPRVDAWSTPTSDDTAYILYTSGSTGAPKGVQVSHGALYNFVQAMIVHLTIDVEDCFLAITTLSFDIAALELFLPLCVGARVRLVERQVAANGRDLLNEINAGVSVLQATPTTWQILIEAGWNGSRGLKALCGGEALQPELAQQIRCRSKATWNMYGPTETTIWSLLHEVSEADSIVPIGKPIANTLIYVLDPWGSPAPVGIPGELHIGGRGVATGYVGKPELTSAKFIPDPFAVEEHSRMFKTGDMARYRTDGELEFLGRCDRQIKLRGYRIELDEIENAILQCEGVQSAVVVVTEEKSYDGGHLIAYYTNSEGTASNRASAEILMHLERKLPPYMIPYEMVVLDALPLLPSGKLDRRTLSQRTRGAACPPSEPELTLTEETIRSLWIATLRLDSIGLDESFLALGGHSLMVIRLINRIRSQFHVEIEFEWFLSSEACIRSLARTIDTALSVPLHL